MHTLFTPQTLGEAKRLKNRRQSQWWVRLVPWVKARVSGPCMSRSRESFAATSSRVCSQDTRSHFPSPRAPTRFKR